MKHSKFLYLLLIVASNAFSQPAGTVVSSSGIYGNTLYPGYQWVSVFSGGGPHGSVGIQGLRNPSGTNVVLRTNTNNGGFVSCSFASINSAYTAQGNCSSHIVTKIQ